jgi:transcriptional regulator with XRE-family HTH domain
MIRLQREREARGLSKNALASLARLPHGRCGQLENGRARPPRDAKELVRLAGVLGIADPGSLLDEVGDDA